MTRSRSSGRVCWTTDSWARNASGGGVRASISDSATQDPQPEVHITVDKFAKYEIVAQTLADLQHRGLKKIGFVNNDFF